jgi:hypothetical protein
MGFDVVRRVRWGNVGRAVGAVALVAAVVAWPRLAAAPARVPEREAVPVVGGPAGTSARPRREPRVRRDREPRQVGRRREPRVRRDRERRQVVRRREPRVRRPHAVVVAPPVRAPTPAPTVDPAQAEFGFEGGG